MNKDKQKQTNKQNTKKNHRLFCSNIQTSQLSFSSLPRISFSVSGCTGNIHSTLHRGLFVKHFLPHFADQFLDRQVLNWYAKNTMITQKSVYQNHNILMNLSSTARYFPSPCEQHSPASHQQSLRQQSGQEVVTTNIKKQKKNHTHGLSILECRK